MKRWSILAIVVPIIAVVGLIIVLIPRPAPAAPQLVGTVFNAPVPAAGFTLTDQRGRVVSLASLRGAPVVLTFLEANCGELCPVIADDIRLAAKNLRESGGRVHLVAISTNPEGDTRTAVQSFLRKHGGSSLWIYLNGSRTSLTPIWRRYYVYAPPKGAPPALRDSHTAATYIIDAQGKRRVLFGGTVDPRKLARDLRILDGLPAGPASGVHIADVAGSQAPAFSLPTLDGRTLSLRSMSGHVVLLNFWATWCIPCRQETPLLQKTYETYRKRGLIVIGVDKQEGVGTVRSFVHRFHLKYPIVLDKDASVTDAYLPSGFDAIPFTVLIDASDTVMNVHEGQIDHAWLKAYLDPLIGSTASTG